MFGRFQKISRNPTSACNHAWEMEESSWQRRIRFCIIHGSFKSFRYKSLLLAKLKAYGSSLNAVKLIHSYLNNRKQQVQNNNKFSSEDIVIAGVSQGSIDGPLLFNLFINDLTFFIQYCTLSNYAEDNNLFSISKNKDEVKNIISSDFSVVKTGFMKVSWS